VHGSARLKRSQAKNPVEEKLRNTGNLGNFIFEIKKIMATENFKNHLILALLIFNITF
jgi:hypothetical protein